MADKATKKDMNLHQKLLKISELCDVLRKDKAAYGYKYVEESAIQACLTAGLQKYGVLLTHNIVPGTMNVTPVSYEKYDAKNKVNKMVHEYLVTAETTYTWINADDPEERICGTYVIVGMQEDPSMAFGSGETYCNRYYLLKMLQIATTEDDPDKWRTDQKEAADKEDKKAEEELRAAIHSVVEKASQLIASGVDKNKIAAIVAEHNNGNKNPSSIESIDVCNEINKALNNIKKENNK